MSDLPPAVAEHAAWMRTRNLAQPTVELRLHVIRLLAEQVAPRDLLAVTAGDLHRWQTTLGDRVSRVSEASYVSQLRQWLKWTAKHEGTAVGLVDELIVPRLPRALPRPIAEDDLELAIAAAPARLRPWLVLAAFSGLRAGEIAGLRAEDLHLADAPPWLLIRGKGQKERVVPASGVVVQALREHGVPRHGPVFPRHDGQPGPNRRNVISQLCSEHLHSLGIPGSAHSLRHFFATKVYRVSGGDLLLTADLLGHSSVQTTRRYAAADAARGAAVVAALGGQR